MGQRLRTSHSSKQSLHATDGDVGRDRLRSMTASATAPAGRSRTRSTVEGLSATVNIPTHTRTQESPLPTAAVSSSPGGDSPVRDTVDWSKEPLPPNWERKLPKGTNRVSELYCTMNILYISILIYNVHIYIYYIYIPVYKYLLL